MRLPKGTSYKFLSTKDASLDSLREEFVSERFSGYLRMTVESGKEIDDGYLLIKDGEVVGAEFEVWGKGSLFGKDAHKKIKEGSKLPGIIDIYKFTDFQIQLSIEENEEALLLAPHRRAPEEKVEEKLKEKTKPPQPIEVSVEPERSVEEEVLKKRKGRMELLKKFGLKEPGDGFVDDILQSFKLPTEKEINRKSKELKKEILQRIKKKTKLEEFDLYIHSSKTESAVAFDIDVYVRPFNKKIEEEVKSTIEDAMKEKLEFPYEKELSVNAA
ncbi:MAG: DUF2226 domain-containing protein [Candidatus Hydrothermarchaeales archaeon]